MTVKPLKKGVICGDMFWRLCENFQQWFVTSTTEEDNPFGFRADAWPLGPVEDTSSVSWFITCLLNHNATVFLASDEAGEMVGITIGVILTQELLAVPAFNLTAVGGEEGDYYFAAFVVKPESRGHGVGRQMAMASIMEAVEITDQDRKMLLRTHRVHPRVVELFQRRQFKIIATYKYEQFGSVTPRVVLGSPIAQLQELLAAH